MFYDAILSGILNIPGSLGDFSTLHYLIGLYYMACIGIIWYICCWYDSIHKYIEEEEEEIYWKLLMISPIFFGISLSCFVFITLLIIFIKSAKLDLKQRYIDPVYFKSFWILAFPG